MDPAPYSFLHQAPLWLELLIFLLMFTIALEAGHRFGRSQASLWKDTEVGGGKIVLSSMSSLLALMLAFCFASGLTSQKELRRAVVDEANAIGTAYLRTSFLEEPGRSQLREALLTYTRTRVVNLDANYSAEDVFAAVEISEEARAGLWPALQAAVSGMESQPFAVSIMSSVNDVMDADTVRRSLVFENLPVVVFSTLIMIACATVAVAGFNAGILGRMSRLRTTLLILVLAFTILLILDFDRPRSGTIRISQGPLREVIAEMEQNSATAGETGTPRSFPERTREEQ